MGTSAAYLRPPGQLQIPGLWCPIPPAVHPQAAALEDHAIDWMTRFGYITSARQELAARGAQFGTLAARVYPRGPFEVAAFGCDLMIWLFLTDDEYVERAVEQQRQLDYARHVLRSTHILRDPGELPAGIPAGETHHALALRDLRRRWSRLAPGEQVLRLVDGIAEYLAASGAEVIFRSLKAMPSLAEYTSMREAAIGLRSVCFVVTEMTALSPLPGQLFSQPRIQRIARSAARLNGWTNDILSGIRELRWPGAINLITVLAREHGCTHQEALGLAARMHAEETRTFLELAGREREQGCDPRVDAYLTGLAAWTRGNLDWSRITGRYHVGAPHTASPGPQSFGE